MLMLLLTFSILFAECIGQPRLDPVRTTSRWPSKPNKEESSHTSNSPQFRVRGKPIDDYTFTVCPWNYQGKAIAQKPLIRIHYWTEVCWRRRSLRKEKKHLRIRKGAIELEFLLFLFLFSVFVFFKESCDNWVFSLAWGTGLILHRGENQVNRDAVILIITSLT